MEALIRKCTSLGIDHGDIWQVIVSRHLTVAEVASLVKRVGAAHG